MAHKPFPLFMRLLLVVLCCCVVSGCRKKKPQIPEVPPPPAVEAEATAPASSPAPVTAPATAAKPAGPHPGEPADPKAVKTAYHQYFAKIGSFPNHWEDMIRQKIIPAVPPGKNGQPLDFAQFTLWEAGRPPR